MTQEEKRSSDLGKCFALAGKIKFLQTKIPSLRKGTKRANQFFAKLRKLNATYRQMVDQLQKEYDLIIPTTV